MTEPLLAPYAARVHWQSPAPLDQRALETLLAHLLEEVARRADAAGARLVGHIKALATFPDGGYVRGSVTSPGQAADTIGVVPGRHHQFDLTLNVLVYGLTEDEVDQIVRAAVQRRARDAGAAFVVDWPTHHLERLVP
ncbi:MAG: hypothetical protein M5U01_08685 [Ardenticatenaceae bacterium]|nr:hypothetical protein [Ardenticatenaceae bacterium]HBY98193.1 hypothetical protein [Chloroflexota bacterium]